MTLKVLIACLLYKVGIEESIRSAGPAMTESDNILGGAAIYNSYFCRV